jgi:hypothetical protein
MERKKYSAPSGLGNGGNPVPVLKTTGYTTFPFRGKNANSYAMHLKELKKLFKETQQLPQAKAISEEEIYAEVEAYRNDYESSHLNTRCQISQI